MDNGRVAGIVAEYNPFHAGHGWMIERLREEGHSAVVCVISGDFVQRGEAALLPASLRAQAAVAGGADLVFRLPAAWATASAEGFGRAGVGLLCALGCVDTLAFGAETADAGRLAEVAEILRDERLGLLVREELKKGGSFAAARAAVADTLLPGAGEVLRSPNNILGVEYCKALAALAPALAERAAALGRPLRMPKPLALPRAGAAHDGPPAAGFASASHLRVLWAEEGAAALAPYVPAACLPYYQQAEEEGRVLDAARYEIALLSRLRGLSRADFDTYPAAGEGLGGRLAVAAREATGLARLYDTAKSKRFAHARVRRLALAAALGLSPHPAPLPPFLHLLAASERGLALLKNAKQTALAPLSASLARLAGTSPAAAVAAGEEARAADFHALCLHSPQKGGGAYTEKVRIVRRTP